MAARPPRPGSIAAAPAGAPAPAPTPAPAAEPAAAAAAPVAAPRPSGGPPKRPPPPIKTEPDASAQDGGDSGAPSPAESPTPASAAAAAASAAVTVAPSTKPGVEAYGWFVKVVRGPITHCTLCLHFVFFAVRVLAHECHCVRALPSPNRKEAKRLPIVSRSPRSWPRWPRIYARWEVPLPAACAFYTTGPPVWREHSKLHGLLCVLLTPTPLIPTAPPQPTTHNAPCATRVPLVRAALSMRH